MSQIFSKKYAQLMDKIDEKVIQIKINNLVDILKKGDINEIKRKLEKVDSHELLRKLNEFDQNKLRNMNFDMKELNQFLTDENFALLAQLLGEPGKEIVEKLKTFLRQI